MCNSGSLIDVVTKRRNSWACRGNPNPEQETIKGTHTQETPAYQPLIDCMSSGPAQTCKMFESGLYLKFYVVKLSLWRVCKAVEYGLGIRYRDIGVCTPVWMASRLQLDGEMADHAHLKFTFS